MLGEEEKTVFSNVDLSERVCSIASNTSRFKIFSGFVFVGMV